MSYRPFTASWPSPVIGPSVITLSLARQPLLSLSALCLLPFSTLPLSLCGETLRTFSAMSRRLKSVRGDTGTHLTHLPRVGILSSCEPRPSSLRQVGILSVCREWVWVFGVILWGFFFFGLIVFNLRA
jgi:hypothetical protein